MTAVDTMVPPQALRAFLAHHGFADRPLTVTRIGQGRSNLTFRVDDGEHVYVLRRPPLGDIPETAHDMLREYRVLSALTGTAARVPRPLLACPDPDVLGVPFYLMEVVEGVVIRDEIPAAFTAPRRATIGHELIDALAELHQVDYMAAGLADLGRPEGYTARQVRRWSRQWEFMQTRDLADIEVVREWLAAHVPARSPATIVHGDYKLDNVIFAPRPPARLRAILDWEMATLGDPLADLGYLMVFWQEPGDEGVLGLRQPTQQVGFPSRAELIARYEERTGFAMTDLTFYRTLALWKLAILSEGLYKRHLAGKTDSSWYALLEHSVPALAAQARRWCGA